MSTRLHTTRLINGLTGYTSWRSQPNPTHIIKILKRLSHLWSKPNPFMVNPNPLLPCRVHVGLRGHVKNYHPYITLTCTVKFEFSWTLKLRLLVDSFDCTWEILQLFQEALKYPIQKYIWIYIWSIQISIFEWSPCRSIWFFNLWCESRDILMTLS